MSNPSFSNIDMWLFELAEGNLSPEQVDQLELFLLNHPELDVDRDVWEMAKVEKQEVAYPDASSLQRKRRPVTAFAFAGLLLLLIGSGAYLAWDGQFDDFSAADISAQNELVKAELLNHLKASSKNVDSNGVIDASSNQTIVDQEKEQSVSNSMSALAEPIVRNGAHDKNGVAQNEHRTDRFNGEMSAELSTLIVSTPLANSAIANPIIIDNPSQTEISIPMEAENSNLSVTNTPVTSYTNELNEALGNVENTKSKDFALREPREINAYQDRIWKDRKSVSIGNAIASKGNRRATLKGRIQKFSRSLENMLNAPIALKNSRDPHYHVPGMTPNDINFSSAGTLIGTRVQTMSRLQWQGQDNEQLMNQLSADGYLYDIRGGWGVQLNHQWYKNGGLQVSQAAFTYSPKISVSNWFSVEPSVRVKIGNKQLNAERMQDENMVEIDRGNTHGYYANGATPIGKNLWYKDLGVGLLVNTKWFFAGLQVDNLFKYNDNMYDNNWNDPRRAQNHFVATVGTDWISMDRKLSLSPYVVYQKNEQLSELWGGANFAYEWFNVGVAASTNLEPAASIGMKFDHFSLQYNADYTESKMLGKKALSHQLSLRFVVKHHNYKNQLFKQ